MTADSRFVWESASIATAIALPVAIGFAIAADGDVFDWDLTWAGLVLAAAAAAACSAHLSTRHEVGPRLRAAPFGLALRVVAVAYLAFLGVAMLLVLFDQSFRGAAGMLVVAPRADNIGLLWVYIALVSLGVGLVPALLLEYVAGRRYLRRLAEAAAGRT